MTEVNGIRIGLIEKLDAPSASTQPNKTEDPDRKVRL
jgi:hypothetical protein